MGRSTRPDSGLLDPLGQAPRGNVSRPVGDQVDEAPAEERPEGPGPRDRSGRGALFDSRPPPAVEARRAHLQQVSALRWPDHRRPCGCPVTREYRACSGFELVPQGRSPFRSQASGRIAPCVVRGAPLRAVCGLIRPGAGSPRTVRDPAPWAGARRSRPVPGSGSPGNRTHGIGQDVLRTGPGLLSDPPERRGPRTENRPTDGPAMQANRLAREDALTRVPGAPRPATRRRQPGGSRAARAGQRSVHDGRSETARAIGDVPSAAVAHHVAR